MIYYNFVMKNTDRKVNSQFISPSQMWALCGVYATAIKTLFNPGDLEPTSK
jgi:hypothetical protein